MLNRLYRSFVKLGVISSLVAISMAVYMPGDRAYAYEATFQDGSCGNYSCDPLYPAGLHFYESTKAASDQQQAVPQPILYQVNSGDTLYNIARTFGVSVNELTAANAIHNPRSLHIGQELHIPGKVIDVNLPSGSSPVVSRVIMSTLTAYTAGVESTGKRPSDPGYGVTYSGSNASEGRTIAVDPGVIPIGATVFIDGIGVRKAEDIGSAIRGARIDVFMNDLGQAREFGVKKNVIVYVLAA